MYQANSSSIVGVAQMGNVALLGLLIGKPWILQNLDDTLAWQVTKLNLDIQYCTVYRSLLLTM